LQDVQLQINSLGDAESKQRYRDLLVAFLAPKKEKLSEDSQRRLNENPLRILDSKDPRDQEAVQGAPPATEALSEKSRKHFDEVRRLLNQSAVGDPQSAIRFSVNANLVRGFDYYTETLWEVTAAGLGAQNAIGGGGRYDNLVENLGGRPTPGVGFGSGLERLLIALEAQKVALPHSRQPLVWLVYHGEPARQAQWQLLQDLRAQNIAADMDLSGRSVKAQFKLADREAADYVITVGESELQSNSVVLKDLKTGEQTTLPKDQVIARLKS
jgi:histidyl-tRNA synthetase